MKSKRKGSSDPSDTRAPIIPSSLFDSDKESGIEQPSPEVSVASEDASPEQYVPFEPFSADIDLMQKEFSNEKGNRITSDVVQKSSVIPASEAPVEIALESRSPSEIYPGYKVSSEVDFTSSTNDLLPKKKRIGTVYEPKTKAKHFVKLSHIFVPLVIVTVVVLCISIIRFGNLSERLASPMTLKGEEISSSEFSFMYHFVLLENGVDIQASGTEEMLQSEGENGFATYRDYFLDMTALEIQANQILYDDAVANGYAISDANRDMAQAYIDWLSTKAADIGVNLDEYIKGYFGEYVTKDVIMDVLSKKYFAEEYANGAKLDQLKASDEQAESAYAEDPNSYDLVSYRSLRIVYEQKDQSFISTANLHAQQIIDGIGHDESQFEAVAATFFTGDEQQRLLVPNSTLTANARYDSIDNAEWQAWLYDPIRTPGDCTIFQDENGFPIILCFSSRTRQTEPLRDVRFLYINREDTTLNQVGYSEADILPLAQTIFDSVTDENSMITLETTYADEIAEGLMSVAHNSDTYQGEMSDDFNAWIFDPARVAGDKTIIETDSQVILAFYVQSSENPEWFDRVNSFIRMNNYQAFLLEKQQEYPYEFNDEGLSKIYDVAP